MSAIKSNGQVSATTNVRLTVVRINFLGHYVAFWREPLRSVWCPPKGICLILNFPTEELREICAKRSVATAKLGTAAALELAQKLADMEACENAAEFCKLYPGLLSDVSGNEKSLNLSSGHRVNFRSGHPSYPNPPAKVSDWNNTTRLRIVSIETSDG
jgi:hypothetical protein